MSKVSLSYKLKSMGISLFFKTVIAPLDFLYQIGHATKGKKHALMWCVAGFIVICVSVKPLSDELQKHYSIGMDLSAVSSNDHVFFKIKKNDSVMTDLKINDYISFSSPLLEPVVSSNQVIIKQIKGLPNDKLLVKNGEVFINGEKVAEIHDKALERFNKKRTDFDREEIVPANHVFVIGSYPRSYDSRYWGFLPIEGKVDRAYPILF